METSRLVGLLASSAFLFVVVLLAVLDNKESNIGIRTLVAVLSMASFGLIAAVIGSDLICFYLGNYFGGFRKKVLRFIGLFLIFMAGFDVDDGVRAKHCSSEVKK